MQEERTLHEAKLAKMEAEMNLVFQQKVAEKESKLKQSEEELYARHREMKEALEKQRLELEDKKRRIESGRPLTPEKSNVGHFTAELLVFSFLLVSIDQEESLPPNITCSRRLGDTSFPLLLRITRLAFIYLFSFCSRLLIYVSSVT